MVREVTDAEFQSAVIERSKERPVIVDFWATWCAPCRSLSPIIERVGAEHADGVETLKMDVDANPAVSQAMGIRSIPTVVAFKDGAPVDGFLGAQPEPVVRDFYKRLLPSEDDLIVARAAEAGDTEALRRVLNRDPDHRGAILALAPLAEPAEGLALLKRLPEDDEVRRVRAGIELASGPSASSPAVRDALANANEGRHEEALAALLAAVRSSDGAERDEARAAMLDLFAVLGDGDPLVARYRRELASALF